MSGDSTGTGNPGGGPNNGGMQAAAAAFLNLLEEPDEANQEQDEEANLDDETEEQLDEPEASDESEEADEDEESETAEDEESEDEPAPTDQKFTVTIDGKDEEVSLDELRNGYQRTADYTRKTQALAQARKEHEAEIESARAERAEYAELLPKLRAALEAGIGPEPDWDALRQQDPVRASLLWQQREDQRRALAQVKAEEDRAKKAQADDEAKAMEARAIEQRNKLLGAIPEWKDEKVAAKESKAIRAQLVKVGFAEDEAALTDYRHVVLARKAMRYDQIMDKRAKLRGVPPADTAPVVQPGGKRPKPKGNVEAAQARLKKTGSVRDAAAVFANFL